MRLILYGTSACHLCEQAEAIILEVYAANPGLADHLPVESVDVVSDSALVERYGMRIPVLAFDQGKELFWPFDHDSLVSFVNDGLKNAC